MAVIPVQTASNMPLFMQLGDRDTGMYIRARVYNSTGSEISGSPVELTHVANGLYLNYTLAKPAGQFLLAQITAYTDPAFNTLANYDTKTDMIVSDVAGAKADPLTTSETADAVWDAVLASHTTAGTTGAKLDFLTNGCPTYDEETFQIAMPREADLDSIRTMADDVNIALGLISQALKRICETE